MSVRCLTVHNYVETYTTLTVTTIVYLIGIKPALNSHKNQWFHLTRNINCLKNLIQQNGAIVTVSFSSPNSKHCYIVCQCISVIYRNRITTLVLSETTDWKALLPFEILLGLPLSATECNFSIRWIVPVMWSYHSYFDSKVSLLIEDQYLAAVVWKWIF